MVKQSKFLTPKSLWEDFDGSEPLKETKIDEMRYNGIVYEKYYFSGRTTETDRVRIFGLYVSPEGGKKNRDAVLYVPDVTEKVAYEVINEYVSMGFSVLTVDLYGKREGEENYTKYPEDVSYANYEERGRHCDFADLTAKETCEYEWTCVLRYALNFIRQKNADAKIGAVGVKMGGNLVWQLAATDDRLSCCAIMFGAGWSAYKGIFRYSEVEIDMNEERRRFIAAVDAHAYAPYVKCPVLFLTSTNSEVYDFDRANDTLSRIKDGVEYRFNFAANYNRYLDEHCKRDLALFLKARLGDGETVFPDAPEIELSQNGNYLTARLSFDASAPVSETKVFVSDGGLDPAHRDWESCDLLSSDGNSEKFGYVLRGGNGFAYAYAAVTYKSGWTASSKVAAIKITGITPKRSNLIYSGRDGLEGITFYDKNAEVKDVFVKREDFIVLTKGADDILGIYSKYGLITYRIGAAAGGFTENSMLKFDVFPFGFASIDLAFLKEEDGKIEKYLYSFELHAGNIWQNKTVKLGEFKSADGMGIKKFDGVFALLIEGDGKFAVNNILVI
ncbi:MAG: dienelactone hydrolase family protein [Clostridia bacterium]|nr:dienelactone hydrolase family protein [Clostridia bacterium]